MKLSELINELQSFAKELDHDPEVINDDGQDIRSIMPSEMETKVGGQWVTMPTIEIEFEEGE